MRTRFLKAQRLGEPCGLARQLLSQRRTPLTSWEVAQCLRKARTTFEKIDQRVREPCGVVDLHRNASARLAKALGICPAALRASPARWALARTFADRSNGFGNRPRGQRASRARWASTKRLREAPGTVGPTRIAFASPAKALGFETGYNCPKLRMTASSLETSLLSWLCNGSNRRPGSTEESSRPQSMANSIQPLE